MFKFLILMNEDFCPPDCFASLSHESENADEKSISDNSEGNHLKLPNYREKIQQIIKKVE